jgi:hypothetical protein
MDLSAKLRAKGPEIEIKRGATVELSFSANRLFVDEPIQKIIWEGRATGCQFAVTIPQGTEGVSFVAAVRVSLNGSLIGCIKFSILSHLEADRQSFPLGGRLRHYHTPFVSYASNDRKEVLKRVQMLQILNPTFFLDLLSLDPGDRWEKRLYENIDRCDLFLLFWSQAAKESYWVLQEAEYALKRQQGDPNSDPDIVPVILEQNVSPPQNLSSLHFNDRIHYLISQMDEAETG